MKNFKLYRFLVSALLMVFCFTLASSAEAKSKHRHKSDKSDQTASSESKSKKKDKNKSKNKAKNKAKAKAEEKTEPEEPEVIVNQALANPCYSLENNSQWHQLFADFSKAFQENQFESALEITEKLKKICAASPVLNYSIATTHRELGNAKEALRYYKQAIENTKTFGVSDELLTKFWFARYEMENSDVICKQVDLDACNEQNSRLQQDYSKANTKAIHLNEVIENDIRRRDAIVMWTGTGLGIAGLAAIGAGVGLIINNDIVNNPITLTMTDIAPFIPPNSKTTTSKTVTVNNTYRIGLGVLGAGIGLTVAGVVMAGIGGYNYTHPLSEDVTASWNVSPGNIEFGLKF